jgi:hypothetical protein
MALSAAQSANWTDPEYATTQREVIAAAMGRPEVRSLLAKRQKANWRDPVYKATQVVLTTAGLNKPGVGAKISASRKLFWEKAPEGYWEECCAKVAKTLRKPKIRARMSVAITAKWEDPEYRKKSLAASLARYDTPEKKAALNAKIHTPEANAKRSKTRKKLAKKRPDLGAATAARLVKAWKDPEYRQRMQNPSSEVRAKLSAAPKRMWADPVKRAKTIAAQKRGKARAKKERMLANA